MFRGKRRTKDARHDIRNRIKMTNQKPKITTAMMYSFPIGQPSHSLGCYIIL